MWQILQSWLDEPATRRLGWAIFISMLLHAWLFGGHFLALPSLKKELHIIEAHLQMPEVVPPAVEASEPEALPAAAPPVPEPVPLEPAEIAPETLPEPTPVVENAPAPPAPEPAPAPELPPQSEALPEIAQPVDAGLVINENAHRYVETYFNVSTQVDGPAEGKAKIVYDLMDEKHYKITSLTEPSGVVSLFIGNLVQESEGELVKTGLQPHRYLYQYGNKDDKTYFATFDWVNNTLLLKSSKGEKTEPLVEGAQDLLSFMYQFMFVPPLETMQIPITNGKKLKVYDYQFEGEQLLTGELGEINTLHISRSGWDSEDKMELWLAPGFQYIPIKIRKTEKDGKVYEMTATQINTNRPVINQ